MTNTKPRNLSTAGLNASEPILLDVRTRDEFEMQFVEGSINLPLDEILDGTPLSIDILSEIPKNTEIWVYCVSGARSSIAIGVLQDAGYENVLNKRSIFDI